MSHRSFLFTLVLAAGVGIASASEPTRSQPTSRPASQPTGQWRAVHLMAWGTAGGPEGLPPLKRAITEVLVPLGVNVIVYEVGYNFEFESHPDLRYPPYINKAQARELATLCRKHGIRLIPQFNCLGHQSWVRKKVLFPLLSKYPDLEETPFYADRSRWDKIPRSWCPFHPRINEIVFPMIDELIDAFQADAFHVGMDEVMMVASSKCPRCKGKNPAEWFAKAVNDLHGHLVKEKGLTMLMWGDRLLDDKVMNFGNGYEASRNGTASAIDLIPNDIIICDWHYPLRDEYPSVRYFQEKRFRVLPASWRNIQATEALIAYAHQNATEKMLGHLCTTWTLEPGGFARALLGEEQSGQVSEWAVGSAACVRAAMAKLNEVSRTPR